jgi:pyruvate dehydrogenase E2 component (dihydrolipoamide acetyltransferase)
MRHEFRLADIGEGLEEAEIITWLVAVGDQVDRDQPLIEVMTDKSNAELPAPEAGTIVELGGNVGDMIMVGDLIAAIELHDNAPHNHVPTPAVAPHIAAATDGNIPSVNAAQTAETPIQQRPKASPSTRRQAAERGIDLTTIVGSGPGGRILLSDLDTTPSAAPPIAAPQIPAPQIPVPHAATHQAATPAPLQQAPGVVPLRGIRRAVAKNMAQSWSEIPHIHAFEHIDAAPLLELRQRLRTTMSGRYADVTPLTFFVAAVARALALHPQANASLNMADETITYHGQVNVGVAVAAEQGLVVPVLQAADRLDFETLGVTLAQLVRGAREGVLPREHFLGGTVTVTNFGSLGGEQATPLIRPPESMIVGFGSIAERPFVVDGAIAARSTMHTVVGADHRLLDGDVTTAVLSTIGSLLADPLQLVL